MPELLPPVRGRVRKRALQQVFHFRAVGFDQVRPAASPCFSPGPAVSKKHLAPCALAMRIKSAKIVGGASGGRLPEKTITSQCGACASIFRRNSSKCSAVTRKAGFVQLGLRSLLGIMDLQVDARLPGDIDEVRGNSLGAEGVQDEAAIAARHQPQRADRRSPIA